MWKCRPWSALIDMKTLIALVTAAALLGVGTASAAVDLQPAAMGSDSIMCIGLGWIICFVYYTACTPVHLCILHAE
jgi:hypothetical protein